MEEDIFHPTPIQTRTRSNIKEKRIEDIIQETIINVSAKEDRKKGGRVTPLTPWKWIKRANIQS